MTHIVIVLCCCLSSCLSIAHMRTHIYMRLRTSIDRRSNKCTYEHRQTRAHTHLHVQIIRIFTPSSFYVHPFIILPHSLTSLTYIRLHPLILLDPLDFFHLLHLSPHLLLPHLLHLYPLILLIPSTVMTHLKRIK